MTLTAAALTLRLPGGRQVLTNVHLTVRPGDLVVLLGPNGAGKSTLLRALAGLLPPWSGSVTLGASALAALPPRARAQAIAYLPQAATLDFDFTVHDAVAMGRYSRGDEAAPEGRAAIGRALHDLDLTGHAERVVTQLSGGERQRTWLARLIAGEAPLWLLDEPTTALDARHAFAFLRRCGRHAREGGSVVVALHDLDVADRLARDNSGRVVILHEGALVADAAPEEALSEERIARVFGVGSVRHAHGLSLRASLD